MLAHGFIRVYPVLALDLLAILPAQSPIRHKCVLLRQTVKICPEGSASTAFMQCL